MPSDDRVPELEELIPEMLRKNRYDVGIDNNGSTTFWCMDVDMIKVYEAVIEILVMKEREPDAFAGNIVIRSATDVDDPIPYHGRECEADGDDGRSSSSRHLQSVGGAQPRITNLDSYGPATVDWKVEAVGPYIPTYQDYQREKDIAWNKEQSALEKGNWHPVLDNIDDYGPADGSWPKED